MRQLGTINCRGVLLRSVEFPWLQRMGFAVLCFSEIEKDDVRVQLWCGVTVDRPCAVVLELRCNPPARCLCRKIPADAGLDVALQLVKRDLDAFSMCRPYPVIAAYKGR